MTQDKILTITQVNNYIKGLLSRDYFLSDIWIRGELSNFKHHYSGHMYFTLKDEKSLIRCVMFNSQNSGLKFIPSDGMSIIANGYVSLFETSGQYQLYVRKIEPDGEGSLHVAFEQLKKKLEGQGFFDEKRKRKIPFLPSTIGVVTSATGSVIRDILNIINRRFPDVRIRVYPAAVQGEHAAGQIAVAVNRMNQLQLADVIIIARGGGSLEELWPFNEEIVARSIMISRIPVISAVGHETDFTIADFTADVRAPTPSAAAELVVPEKKALKEKITYLNARLYQCIIKITSNSRVKLDNLQASFVFRQPCNMVYQKRIMLDIIIKNLNREIATVLKNNTIYFQSLLSSLNSLNPMKVLERGYGIAMVEKTGIVIRSVNSVQQGDNFELVLKDGIIDGTIRKIRPEGEA